ncbi:MAG: DUF1565 domain-containing protein [bacterium]|nr:DUF1565 domain-containing protein [bacterium]
MKGLLIFLILFGLAAPGYGANYYVSKSGSDSNPGSEAQPWKTIQKAADTLTAGDTVYIKTGTYNERVMPQNSGSAGNYITYTAYPGDSVTIDGAGINLPNDWGGLFDIFNKSYIKVSGLKVQNAGPNDNNTGILVDSGSYIIIENNHTYNTVSSGIGVWNSSNVIIDGNEVELACNDGEQECLTVAVTDTFEIRNNHVHNGGPGSMGAEGLDGKDGSSNGKIYNNRVHDLNRLGIYLDAWDKHTYNIDVYNNIVYDIRADGITLASESGGLLENINIYNNIVYNVTENGIAITRNGHSATHPMKNINIINNTLYNNGSSDWGGGIMVDNPNLQSAIIRNNILSQNVFYSIDMEADVPMGNVTVDYNLIHGFRNYDDEIKGSNVVEGDPLFVNASAVNFHLQSTSPAVDAGSSSGAPARDYDGNSRPSGSGYDIGAFEYGTSGGSLPGISLNPTAINVTVLSGSTTTVSRTFTVSNSGTGTLEWSVSENVPWLSVSPGSGSGSATVTITVDPSGLMVDGYTGIVSVSSTNASNSPQTVTVNLTVQSTTNDEPPFGYFDTPVNGSTVRSSVPVTGWALDDVAVESVKIYRDPVSAGEGNSMVYIGDAIFIEGARPDVQQLYPGYPGSSKAGWGYMMLTHFLPGGGNGTFTLYAVASDGAGHSVTLGNKTISCDNANAVKPFGAIDTPTQGGTASGSGFINWGWVLTPQPNSIPTDGSTIDVWVNGVKTGKPTYNIYRSDIASLFPSYANSNGAVGYFSLDTTAYTDGVHTIQWTAADNAGNSDGIGSRYFTIQNSGEDMDRSAIDRHLFLGGSQAQLVDKRYSSLHVDKSRPVEVRTGYKKDSPLQSFPPDENGDISIRIRELERVEIHLFPHRFRTRDRGRLILNASPLPIGSTLDSRRGIFYWQPGAGFIGKYPFIFIVPSGDGKFYKKKIVITIFPGHETRNVLFNR